MTIESHLDVTSAYPYRPELDCVAEVPDGSFASYCLAWLDPVTGPASSSRSVPMLASRARVPRRLSPRTRCDSSAVWARTLQSSLRAAIPAYPVPKRLYESLGFREETRLLPFRRTR